MNTKQLRYAVDLYSLKSFQKVADKHGVSRSTVSRSIGQLEDDINAKLFIRFQKDIIPTYAGCIMLNYAKEILKIEEDMKFGLAEDGKYAGIVKIGMGTSRTLSVLTDVLPQFSREYPNIVVQLYEMSTADLMDSLMSHYIDFAVVSRTMNAEGVAFEPLIYEELVLVAPQEDSLVREKIFEKNGKTYIDLRKLEKENFALGHIGQKSRAVADSVFSQLKIKPNVIFQAMNNYTLALMANNGLAYALVPQSCTKIEGNELPHIHIDIESAPCWYVGIAYLQGEEMSIAATQLKKIMKKVLSKTKIGKDTADKAKK